MRQIQTFTILGALVGALACGSDDRDDGPAPAPGHYGTRAPLAVKNAEMAIAALDEKVYVLGGYPATGHAEPTLQIYDPTTDSWRLGAPAPMALHHPVLVGVAGRLYSLGGQTLGPTEDGRTDKTFVYDPQRDAWSEARPMPTARGGGAGAAIGSTIYVVGGRPPAGNAFEAYDVGGGSWTTLPPLPTEQNQRNHLVAAAIGGKIFVAGGRYDGGFFSSPRSDRLDVFDPSTGAWSAARPMARPRGGVAGVAAFGCLHVYGGEGTGTGDRDGVFPDHDVYNPRTDRWTSMRPLPVPFHGVTGGAFVGGLIYMPGGGLRLGGASPGEMHQVFRPSTRCE